MARNDKRRKKARKARRAAAKDVKPVPTETRVARPHFEATQRGGDSAVKLDFTFSGVPVPCTGPDDPKLEERALRARKIMLEKQSTSQPD